VNANLIISASIRKFISASRVFGPDRIYRNNNDDQSKSVMRHNLTTDDSFRSESRRKAIKGTLHMWLIARSCASTQGTDRADDHFGQKLALNEKREAALECHKVQHWSDT